MTFLVLSNSHLTTETWARSEGFGLIQEEKFIQKLPPPTWEKSVYNYDYNFSFFYIYIYNEEILFLKPKPKQ